MPNLFAAPPSFKFKAFPNNCYIFVSENDCDMCTRHQCIQRLNASAPYIREEFGVESLCLFGSVARGDNREGSDVDICVDMPPKALKVVALKHFLQDLLGAAVDVVRRTPRLDAFLQQEIERDGIVIFA